MPFPTGYAPAQVTQGSFYGGGYQIPPEALQYLSPEQIQMLGGSTQQNPVDQFIASLPPEVQSNPSAILQAASTNPSLAQAVAEKFGLDAGSMTFENPYRAPLSEALGQAAKDVLIPWGAATGAIALTGAGGGAAGAAGYGGAATTYPLPAAGGAISATPIATGVGAGTVAGSTTAAGVAGAANSLGTAASTVPKWLDYGLPAINAGLGIYASGKASDAEAAGLDRAITEQGRQFDLTRTDWQPWMDTGKKALSNLNDPQTNFLASPNYQWVRSEGDRDVLNHFSAIGGASSGNALKALSEFNQNLAGNEFMNWTNTELAKAGLGTTGNNAVTNARTNSTNATSNYLADRGATRASGVLGKYGAVAGAADDIYRNALYRRRRAA